MRKVACALLLLGLAACGGQGGGDEASEAADTPSMSATDTTVPDTTMMQDSLMGRDTLPCDTCTSRN
jgi:hypothetical protein